MWHNLIIIKTESHKACLVSSTGLFSKKTLNLATCVAHVRRFSFASTITAARSEFSTRNVYEASRSGIFINAVIRACASFKQRFNFYRCYHEHVIAFYAQDRTNNCDRKYRVVHAKFFSIFFPFRRHFELFFLLFRKKNLIIHWKGQREIKILFKLIDFFASERLPL